MNGQIGTGNTLVQLLVLYTDPESHNAQSYRQTDGQTDVRHEDANRRSCSVQYSQLKKKHVCCILASQVAFNTIVASALSYKRDKNTVQYNTIQYDPL